VKIQSNAANCESTTQPIFGRARSTLAAGAQIGVEIRSHVIDKSTDLVIRDRCHAVVRLTISFRRPYSQGSRPQANVCRRFRSSESVIAQGLYFHALSLAPNVWESLCRYSPSSERFREGLLLRVKIFHVFLGHRKDIQVIMRELVIVVDKSTSGFEVCRYFASRARSVAVQRIQNVGNCSG